MSHHLLSHDLWRCISLKLGPSDRIRFRAVCKLWTSIIPLGPWLMLAQTEESASEDETEAEEGHNGEEEEDEEEGHDEEDEDQEEEEEVEDVEENDEGEEPIKEDQQDHSSPKLLECQAEAVPAPPPPRRGFVSLGDQQIYHIDVPQLHLAQCVGSTGNWLITAHKDKTLRILNPFTRQQFYLPPQSAFELPIYNISYDKFRHLHLWKVILSSSPLNGRDCIAMAIHGPCRVLALARLGDDKWITVGYDGHSPRAYIEDAIFYKGHFFAIIGSGMLLKCDIGDDLTPPTASCLNIPFCLNESFRINSFWEVVYLVEWLGELLLVIKCIDNLNDVTYKTSKLEVYKFDFVSNKWDLLKSLGEHSLFLGFNTSVSVRASNFFGSVKKNCVYFTDDFVGGYRGGRIAGGHDMGVFNLEDNSITPHYTGVSTCFYSPPVWIVPE